MKMIDETLSYDANNLTLRPFSSSYFKNVGFKIWTWLGCNIFQFEAER